MSDETVTVEEAAAKLREHFGYVPWLGAIGIAKTETKQEIHVYLEKKVHPSLKFFDEGWMGFPVKVTFIGKIRLCHTGG